MSTRKVSRDRAYDLGLLFAVAERRGEKPRYSDDGYDILAICDCCYKHEPIPLTLELSDWLRKNAQRYAS